MIKLSPVGLLEREREYSASTMKFLLVSATILASVAMCKAQVSIWTKLNTVITPGDTSQVFEYTVCNFGYSQATLPFSFIAPNKWLVTGYPSTPPAWTSEFTPIRTTDIPGTAFSGTVTLSARTYANPILIVDQKTGYELWENTITHEIVDRELDKRLYTNIAAAWKEYGLQ